MVFRNLPIYCFKTMAPLYSRLRKSRHKRLIILSIIITVTVLFYIVHTVIWNRASLSLAPNKSGKWFSSLKLDNRQLLMPLLSDKDLEAIDYYERREARKKQQNAIPEVKGIVMDQHPRLPPLKNDISAQVQFRVVHLDLKGAPPKMEYLRMLFSMVAAAGANALLIEYEDMFPFEGMLRNVSAYNAYTKKQVVQMLEWARQSGLEVIPLVQTFGHLEYALKLPEFKHLRELSPFPQELCPSLAASHQFVRELVRQVMAVHKETRFLHIGCDEVYHLAACGRCTQRHLDARIIFTDHVTQVATYVRETYPDVTPLVWDDMFRQWSPMDLADSGLGPLVEPVVWVYIDDITRLVPHYVWYMYGQTFANVWVASAFKGAFGETMVAPNLNRHLKNHVSWLHIMESKTERESPDSTPVVQNFRGIILTGWSRYDHFAVLCELLPVALPSLVLNLLYVSFKRTKSDVAKRLEQERQDLDTVLQVWLQQLSCPKSYPTVDLDSLEADPYQWRLGMCAFPGNNLYTAIGTYIVLKSRIDILYEDVTEKQGWLTEYSIKHNYSSPYRVLQALAGTGENGHRLGIELSEFKNTTQSLLSQYYDKFTVQEWLEQKVEPLEKKMKYLESAVRKLMDIDVWPRRPLSYKTGT